MKDYFKGIKVVELASVLAGPSVGLFFSELGAEVIKVENKSSGGDITRTWKLTTELLDSPISAYFCSVNYQKKYLFLNLKDSKDKEVVYSLVKEADIVITNFKKGDDIKLGVDYQTLKNLNSKLIYGEINGFGSESDRVAYDLILQAETGFMSMNGLPNSGPIKMPVALIDLLAGHQLKEGILIALLKRNELGIGSYISVSLYESAIASLANQATNWLMEEKIPKRIGSTHPNIAPYGELFETIDGDIITFAIGSNKQFASLMTYLDLGNELDGAKFKDNISRVVNRIELEKLLKDKIIKKSTKNIQSYTESHLIPMAKVKNLKEVFEDPMAQNMVRSEEIDGVKTKRVSSLAFKFKMNN